MRPVNTKAAFGIDKAPFVEEIVAVLQDESKGEEFLLWNVRLFGPKALEELKEKLRAKGFLPAEETEEDQPWVVLGISREEFENRSRLV